MPAQPTHPGAYLTEDLSRSAAQPCFPISNSFCGRLFSALRRENSICFDVTTSAPAPARLPASKALVRLRSVCSDIRNSRRPRSRLALVHPCTAAALNSVVYAFLGFLFFLCVDFIRDLLEGEVFPGSSLSSSVLSYRSDHLPIIICAGLRTVYAVSIVLLSPSRSAHPPTRNLKEAYLACPG
jgi:hypothetical protein